MSYYDTLPTILPVFGRAVKPEYLYSSDWAFAEERPRIFASFFSSDASLAEDYAKVRLFVYDSVGSLDKLVERLFVLVESAIASEVVKDRSFSALDTSGGYEPLAWIPYKVEVRIDAAIGSELFNIWRTRVDTATGSDIVSSRLNRVLDSSAGAELAKMVWRAIDVAAATSKAIVAVPVSDVASTFERILDRVFSAYEYGEGIEVISYRVLKVLDEALYLDGYRYFVEDGVLKLVTFTFGMDGFVNIVNVNSVTSPFVVAAKVSPRTLNAIDATAGVIGEGDEGKHPDDATGARIDVHGSAGRFAYDFNNDINVLNNAYNWDTVKETPRKGRWYVFQITITDAEVVYEVFDEFRESVARKVFEHGIGFRTKPILGVSNNTETGKRVEAWFDYIYVRKYASPEPSVSVGAEESLI